MYVTMFAGAAFHMIAKSGALQVAVGGVSKRIQNRSYIFIPVMTTLFAVICSTQAVNHFNRLLTADGGDCPGYGL